MKKYQNIRVSKYVNISSSGDYFFRVLWNGGERGYCLGVGFLSNSLYMDGWEQAPKYLIREVKRQIAAMFRDGTARLFEYDRWGNARYENLRYRDTELEATYAKEVDNED